MLNEHADLGIATIVFYVPAVILSAHLLFRRHRRPRMAWYFLFMFSLVRVASGVVVILYEGKPADTGLLIATIILLGVGVMPLIAVTIGMLRIVLAKDFDADRRHFAAVLIARLLFLISVILLVVGGVYVGQYKQPNLVSLGTKHIRAGYILVVVLLIYLVGFQAALWMRRMQLSHSSRTILIGIGLTTPFLAVRIAYAMLSVFKPADSRWNSLSGSIGIFAGMCLMMEYAAMICCIGTGLLIPRIESTKNSVREEQASEQGLQAPLQSEEGFVNRLRRKWDERD